MTPQQREEAAELIAAFGQLKQRARAARAAAGRRSNSADALQQADDAERQLNDLLARMDALAEELWPD